MVGGETIWNAGQLLADMDRLERAMEVVRRLYNPDTIPVGYYESEVEQFRKYGTRKHIKRTL
jgi:hypothetical protein